MANNNNMYRRPVPPPARQGRPDGNRQPRDNGSQNGSNGECSCEELMRAIMEASFFAQDLKLYLDTHPDDVRAIEMFRDACRQNAACKAAFEDSFYPLTACSSGSNGTWDWLDGAFPPKS
jgi:spore coat protein JB